MKRRKRKIGKRRERRSTRIRCVSLQKNRDVLLKNLSLSSKTKRKSRGKKKRQRNKRGYRQREKSSKGLIDSERRQSDKHVKKRQRSKNL